jgi:hypothetical protein
MIFIFDKIKMSISYHGIVGYGSGKVSLPSVSAWNYDLAIMRDPPKSIQTRKIDKPGQTSDITAMIGDSGDRACEAILVYPRGVNPMVGVSYDNYGNNGGQRSGNVSQQGLNVGGGTKQAYLPYRIMNGGAFRPPVRDQRELLPLSRQPRLWTSSFTQPGFTDFSKKVMCFSDNGEELKMVKKADQMLKGNVRPTAVYKLETPIVENYEVKYVIKNPVQVSGFSGVQPNAKFNGEIGIPNGQITNDKLKPELNVNMTGDRIKDIDLSNFDTKRFTQNTLHSDVESGIAKDIATLPIDQLYNVDTDKYTQDVMHNDISANMSKDIGVTSIDELMNMNTDKYTQNVIHNDVYSKQTQNIAVTSIDELMNMNTDNYTQNVKINTVGSNLSQNINVTSIDQLINMDTSKMTKDFYSIDYTAPEKGYNKYDYMHADPDLMRTLPQYQGHTNMGQNIYKRMEGQKNERVYTQNRPTPNIVSNMGGGQKIDTITNRNIALRQTVNAGGFDPSPSIPTYNRENRIIEFDEQKSKMRKSVYDMQQDRNEFLGSIPYNGGGEMAR